MGGGGGGGQWHLSYLGWAAGGVNEADSDLLYIGRIKGTREELVVRPVDKDGGCVLGVEGGGKGGGGGSGISLTWVGPQVGWTRQTAPSCTLGASRARVKSS